MTPNNKKEKSRYYLDDEEAIKDSETPSVIIQEAKGDLVAPSSEKEKPLKNLSRHRR